MEPFCPADAGTPEGAWLRFLRHSDEWSPRPGPLIVVAPHPDDEILGAGGVIEAWAKTGQAVTVLSVTDGEAADLSRWGLGLIRRKELRTALRALSPVHVNVERMAIPDGKVVDHANHLRRAMRKYADAGCTIIAPYEHDGHPDHEIVGRVCAETARAASLPLAKYPVWAWHHTTPSSVQSLRWARFSLTAAARRAKARALECFESQLHPTAGPPIVPPHVLAYFLRPFESFVL